MHLFKRKKIKLLALVFFIESLKKNFLKKALIGVPYTWLLIFFFIPFLIVLKISFAESRIDIPPYSPFSEWGQNHVLHFQIWLKNYFLLFNDPLYRYALLQSLGMASLCTMICLLIGYPMAYAMALSPPKKQTLFLLLVMLPFWTSFLLRVYSWIEILSTSGLINTMLIKLGVIQTPLRLLYTNFSIGIGMVYCYLPFMILPLYASLIKFNWSLLEAAKDLGAKHTKIFFSILLPLTKTGIITGCLFVFIPSLGEFVIPELLGSPKSLMLGKMIWTEFFNNRDWPMASVLSIVMVLVMILPLIIIYRKIEKRSS